MRLAPGSATSPRQLGYQILYVRIPAVPVLTDVSKKEEEGLWEDYKLDDNQVSDSGRDAQLCGQSGQFKN